MAHVPVPACIPVPTPISPVIPVVPAPTATVAPLIPVAAGAAVPAPSVPPRGAGSNCAPGLPATRRAGAVPAAARAGRRGLLRPSVARRRRRPRRRRLLRLRAQLGGGRRRRPRARHGWRRAQDPRRRPVCGRLPCCIRIRGFIVVRCGRPRNPPLRPHIWRCLLCNVALAGPGSSVLCMALAAMPCVLPGRGRVPGGAAGVGFSGILAPLRSGLFQGANALFTLLSIV